MFGADIKSSLPVDNKKKDALIIGEGPTETLYGTILTAAKSIQQILQSMIKSSV